MKRTAAAVLALCLAVLLLGGCGREALRMELVSRPPSSVATAETTGAGTSAAEQQTTARTTARTTKKSTAAPTAAAPATTRAPATTTQPIEQPVTSYSAPTSAPPTQIQEEEAVAAGLTPVAVGDYYGRTQLEAAGKPAMLTAYLRIASAAERLEEQVDLGDLGLSIEEVRQVYAYYEADFPQHFWRDIGYSVQYLETNRMVTDLTMTYTMNEEQRTAAKAAVQQQAQQLLAGITDSMKPYEREKTIHDRLVQAVEYDVTQSQADIHNLYGALVRGVAVCDGYSHAFQYLLRQAGIPCLFVTGDSAGQAHAWNMVQIDGDYYYVDVTWDDPVYETLTEKPVFYAYFNITTQQLLQDHTLDDSNYPLPSCTEKDANYFVREGMIVDSFNMPQATALLLIAKETGIARVYVEGSMMLFQAELNANWSEVARRTDVYDDVQLLTVGQELVLLID